MRTTFLYLTALSVIIPLTTIPSFAQTAVSEADPMAYAKSLHPTQSNSAVALTQPAYKAKTLNSAEYFSHNYGSETAVPKQVIQKLTAKYGPPKTGRGDLKVWEIKDPQNRTVTIMVGSNKAGQQEYIIDKRSPLRRTNAPINSSKIRASKVLVAPHQRARSKALLNERD